MQSLIHDYLPLNESNSGIKQCNTKHFHQVKDQNKRSYKVSVMLEKQFNK